MPLYRFGCVERYFNQGSVTHNSTIVREMAIEIVKNQLKLRPSKSNTHNEDCLIAECARRTKIVQHRGLVGPHDTVDLNILKIIFCHKKQF